MRGYLAPPYKRGGLSTLLVLTGIEDEGAVIVSLAVNTLDVPAGPIGENLSPLIAGLLSIPDDGGMAVEVVVLDCGPSCVVAVSERPSNFC